MNTEAILSDAEARQPRRKAGEPILRIAQQTLPVPARPYKDGIIYLVDGETRQFENQAANLVELTTKAAVAMQEAIAASEEAGEDPEDFSHTVTLADLTLRKRAFVHAPFAEDRDSPWLDEEQYAQPIVGLDIDEKGKPIDIAVLYKAVKAEMRKAPTGARGFSASTGGAFED